MSKARRQSQARAFQRRNHGTPNSSKITPSTAKLLLKGENTVTRNFSAKILRSIANKA